MSRSGRARIQSGQSLISARYGPTESLAQNVLAKTRSMFFQNAQIHYDKDSRLPRFLCGFFMNNPLLHPNGRNLQLDSLIHNLLDELWPAKDVHDINLFWDPSQ